MIDKILGKRYQLIEKIGGGGMALVYKAKCTLLNRYTAIKILRPEFTNDEDFIKRFKVEAQAAASLSHPNVVSIYDVGHDDDINYIVMEYVNGKTLKDYITEKGTIEWKESVNIAMQICSALEHAHKNKIVHRDIKPHNIIITEDLVAKVTDFGIARAVTSSTVTMNGNTIGSVHYFSPEQARGSYTDEKSDIYSLGVVLYEMLVGRVPFDGETPVTIALKHIQEQPIAPNKLKSNIPKALNDVILKALQKDQSQRYQTVTQLIRDLSEVLKNPENNLYEDVDIDCPTQKIPIVKETLIRNIDINNRNAEQKLSNEESENEMANRIENVSTKYSRKDKLAVFLAGITAMILVSVISFFGFRFLTQFLLGGNSKDIPAPELIGKSITEAQQILKDKNIKVVEVDARFDSSYKQGTIISQSPEANIGVKTPGEIKVVISKGGKAITVPKVVGLELREAKYEIQNENLSYKIFNEFSSTPQGYIIRQYPEANSEVDENSTIEIYVSDGIDPSKVLMPNVVGVFETEAKKTLQEKKINLGKTTYDYDKAQPEGIVLKQSIEQGTTVDNKQKVDLVVNKNNTQQEIKPQITKTPQKGQMIYINLDGKGQRESFTVRVETEGKMGKQIVYEKVHSRSDGEIGIPISGSGDMLIRVFIDGSIDSEQAVTF